MTQTAVAYARFSSDNQHEESIAAQLRAIREYADKENVTLLKEYIDEARSATTDDRPNFLRMVKDITTGRLEVDYVYVHKLDRFARNRYDSAIYRRELAQHGVKLIAVAQPTGDGPESIILEAMIEAMAEYYSKNLSNEVKTKMREYALKATHLGGLPPLGYDVDPETKKYVINPQEAPAIKMIFEMYVKGHSYPEIIEKLNALGYKTKKGRPFVQTSIYEILRNEKYTGTYIFNRAVSKQGGKRNNHRSKDEEDIIKIPDAFPAIIDKKTFEEVKKKMEIRKQGPAAAKAKEVYLLTGLVYCGQCNGAMVGNRRKAGRDKKIYTTYECSNRKRLKTCSAKGINKDYLENIVLDKLINSIFNEEAIPVLVRKLNNINQKRTENQSGELKQAKEELASIDGKIKNIVDAIADGLYNSSLKDKLKELEERKVMVGSMIRELERKQSVKLTDAMMKRYLEKDRQAIESRDLSACKAIINNYVDKVLVYENAVKVFLKIVDLDGGGGPYHVKSTIDISSLRHA